MAPPVRDGAPVRVKPSPRRPTALPVAACLLPWSWYLVRDAHPLFDWVAILLPALLAAAVSVLLLAALIRRSVAWLCAGVAWLFFGVVVLVTPWSPADAGRPVDGVTIAAANVLGSNPRTEAVAADMLRLSADVLVVSELPAADRTVAARLDARYPHAFRTSAAAGVGVWSRFPLRGERLPEDGVLAASRGGRVVVEGPSGPFVLYALHLYRPSRHALGPEVTIEQQRVMVDALDARARAEDPPTLLAGDLNLTDRGSAYRTLVAGRVDALRSAWAAPTSFRFRNRPLLLRIDHVLLPEGWCADGGRRARLTGSDHHAVAATVGLCRRRS